MNLAFAILPLLLVAGSLGHTEPRQTRSADSATASVQDELRARTAAFSRAIVAASGSGWPPEAVARIADFYAVDTVNFPPRGAPLRGRAALAAYWSRSAERRMLSHSAIAERIDVSGNLATEWGTLSVTSQQGDAAPVQVTATYVTIWKRGEDGVWRKLMDTWW